MVCMMCSLCAHLALGPGAMGVHIISGNQTDHYRYTCVTVQLLTTLTCSATVTCNYLCIMAKQHV